MASSRGRGYNIIKLKLIHSCSAHASNLEGIILKRIIKQTNKQNTKLKQWPVRLKAQRSPVTNRCFQRKLSQ